MWDEFEHAAYAATIFTLKHVVRLIVFACLACLTVGALAIWGDALGMWSYYVGCVVCLSFIAASFNSLERIIKGDNHG